MVIMTMARMTMVIMTMVIMTRVIMTMVILTRGKTLLLCLFLIQPASIPTSIDNCLIATVPRDNGHAPRQRVK